MKKINQTKGGLDGLKRQVRWKEFQDGGRVVLERCEDR